MIVLPNFDDKGRIKNTPCVAITASKNQLPLFDGPLSKIEFWRGGFVIKRNKMQLFGQLLQKKITFLLFL